MVEKQKGIIYMYDYKIVEQISRKKKSMSGVLRKVMILFAVIFVIMGIAISQSFMLAGFLLVALYFVYDVFSQKDYEYTLENDQLSIDVIYGKKYRKTAHVLELKNLEVVAPHWHESVAKYKKNGVFSIPYTNKKGYEVRREFYDKGFKRKELPNRTLDDRLPNTVAITGGRNGLITRLNARVCENCGATDNLEMHHVRKLKNLKGKSDWEIKMISRNRKTLAVCSICHHKIHSGKLN